MQDVTTGGHWVKGTQDLTLLFLPMHAHPQLPPNKMLKNFYQPQLHSFLLYYGLHLVAFFQEIELEKERKQ